MGLSRVCGLAVVVATVVVVLAVLPGIVQAAGTPVYGTERLVVAQPTSAR